MKLLSASILFAWALLVNNVSAGGLAGAYERIFFYLVYKLENDVRRYETFTYTTAILTSRYLF